MTAALLAAAPLLAACVGMPLTFAATESRRVRRELAAAFNGRCPK